MGIGVAFVYGQSDVCILLLLIRISSAANGGKSVRIGEPVRRGFGYLPKPNRVTRVPG